MYVAQAKRKENIVEYLLYMWQVEDLIRAAGVDMEGVERLILPRYGERNEAERRELYRWYSELVDMMRAEGKQQHGHLYVHRIVLMQLEELHRRLLANSEDYVYSGMHLQILPALIQLRAKGAKEESELETALNAVYGYLTLTLKGQEISEETKQSMKQISAFLALLAHRYQMEQTGSDLEPQP